MESTAPLGLEHYFIYRQVERTGWSPVVIGLVTFILVFSGYVLTNFVETGDFVPRAFDRTLSLVVSFIVALEIAVFIYLARKFEEDRQSFSNLTDDTPPRILLAPELPTVRLEILFAVVLATMLEIYFISEGIGMPDPEHLYVYDTIIFYIASILATHFAVRTVREAMYMSHQCKAASIDILGLDRYEVFSRPFIRALTLALVPVCLLPAPYLISPGGRFDTITFKFFLPVMVLVLPALVLPYLRPLWQLRRKIRQVRLAELSLVNEALAGNREALTESRIGRYQAEFATPDLLAWQYYLRDLREWPLHQSVQRLRFYLVLPPLAWSLAVLAGQFVERVN